MFVWVSCAPAYDARRRGSAHRCAQIFESILSTRARLRARQQHHKLQLFTTMAGVVAVAAALSIVMGALELCVSAMAVTSSAAPASPRRVRAASRIPRRGLTSTGMLIGS